MYAKKSLSFFLVLVVGLGLVTGAQAQAERTLTPAQEQAGYVFQILASELALAQGELGVAAVTYLSVARQTRDPAAARRATELCIEARLPAHAEEAAVIWQASAPNDFEAENTLDLLRLVQGKTRDLTKSLQLRRDTARQNAQLDSFYDYLAGLAGRAPNRQEGLRLFEAVSQPDQRNPSVSYTRAMLHERAGDHATMERILLQLIRDNPQHAHAHNALGYHFADRNERLEEALALIQTAHRLAPQDAHITDSMGWVYFRLGRLDLAEQYLRIAHEQQPDAEISTHLGEVLWVKGRKDEAEMFLKQAFQADPRNEVLQSTLKRLGISPLRVHPSP
jgi:tetratricopeptide (TPR) repeat protein